jgi:hypothetical protein
MRGGVAHLAEQSSSRHIWRDRYNRLLRFDRADSVSYSYSGVASLEPAVTVGFMGQAAWR